jgi:hypothetical protein
VVIGREISRAIRSFGLPREVLVKLLQELHDRLPEKYDHQREHRTDDNRYYFARIMISDMPGEHLFVAVVDDTTSYEHLVIFKIGYAKD